MKQLILLVITLFMLNSINAQVLKDTIVANYRRAMELEYDFFDANV